MIITKTAKKKKSTENFVILNPRKVQEGDLRQEGNFTSVFLRLFPLGEPGGEVLLVPPPTLSKRCLHFFLEGGGRLRLPLLLPPFLSSFLLEEEGDVRLPLEAALRLLSFWSAALILVLQQ